ncbi:MAG: EamA family transporter [Caulobacteraceae bacterium]|jgi:transporter family protein|nr:EamA family transporter [Caulobacteraceae bacterium]
MRALAGGWVFWSLLAAVFAAATAILAKVGVRDTPSDLATLVRTLVVVAFAGLIVIATGQWRGVGELSPRTWLFLTLSGLATGASWLCYFRALKLGDAARVAPLDKLSVVLVAVLGTAFLGEQLSLKNWVGVAMIAGGAVLVALQ